MSAHFQSMDQFKNNEARFIKNCETIMDYHDAVDDDFWLEIKLMTPPGFLDRANNFKQKLNVERLNTPGANNRMKGCYSLVPIRDTYNLKQYSQSELKYFQNQ